MPTTFKAFDTIAVRGGRPDPRIERAVATPIFKSTMYEYDGETSYDALGYSRLSSTTNHKTLHAKLAALENAEAALVTGSGMAAISTTLLNVCNADDHLLMIDTPYGGTRTLAVEELPRLGINVTFIDATKPHSWERHLHSNTRGIYVESISNPLMIVPDLEGVVAFAGAHDLVSMIDNTFASPVNFRPAEIGFDLVLHSATKYLNGHSDVAAGAVIGKADLVAKIHHSLNHLGGMLDPEACYMLERGLATLGLRVRRQNETALRIARMLESHEAIKLVKHPGLSGNVGHDIANRLFDGYGGVLSFELVEGGKDAAVGFINRLTLPIDAVSLGGVETLISRPAASAYAATPAAEREALGIGEGLLRLSVGIEDADELVADIERALTP